MRETYTRDDVERVAKRLLQRDEAKISAYQDHTSSLTPCKVTVNGKVLIHSGSWDMAMKQTVLIAVNYYLS